MHPWPSGPFQAQIKPAKTQSELVKPLVGLGQLSIFEDLQPNVMATSVKRFQTKIPN